VDKTPVTSNVNLLRSIRPLGLEIQSFLDKSYPDFVTASSPSPIGNRQVIVFMFHTVKPDTFESQLMHLARNGYQTIDTAELYAFITGKATLSGPSVMLTFDDGERSLYRVAYPLLKKHGMKAVNFIVTGRVHKKDEDRPSTGKQWLTWPEVLEMHRDGVIDFQSHTLLHENMFVSERLRDFVRPGLFTDALLVDRPLVRTSPGECLLQDLGAPVYDMSPRMMNLPKFYDRADIRDACTGHVKNHGGEYFFRHRGWRKELEQVWQNAKGNQPAGETEDQSAQRSAMLDSLQKSRDILAERINRPVYHLAYPWASGGSLSVSLSKEAGYLSNFWGPLPGNSAAVAGQDPFYISRLKDDYLLRLPGKGRISLLDVFTLKFRRRATMNDIY
jgi:Polysaccharide deacetylase